MLRSMGYALHEITHYIKRSLNVKLYAFAKSKLYIYTHIIYMQGDHILRNGSVAVHITQ